MGQVHYEATDSSRMNVNQSPRIQEETEGKKLYCAILRREELVAIKVPLTDALAGNVRVTAHARQKTRLK
jgi:hypothetical protein